MKGVSIDRIGVGNATFRIRESHSKINVVIYSIAFSWNFAEFPSSHHIKHKFRFLIDSVKKNQRLKTLYFAV